MDEQRAQRPPPETLKELPEHVRRWLNGIDEEDISRFERWNAFIVWFETTSLYSRRLVLFLMGAFGLYTSILFIWARWSK